MPLQQAVKPLFGAESSPVAGSGSGPPSAVSVSPSKSPPKTLCRMLPTPARAGAVASLDQPSAEKQLAPGAALLQSGAAAPKAADTASGAEAAPAEAAKQGEENGFLDFSLRDAGDLDDRFAEADGSKVAAGGGADADDASALDAVQGVATFAMCASDSEAAESADLEDVYNFDQDKMADLLSAGASMEELVEVAQKGLALAFELRMQKAVAMCASDSEAAESADLEDVYNFDRDKMADLLSAGASTEELVEVAQEGLALAFEPRTQKAVEEAEEQASPRGQAPAEEALSGGAPASIDSRRCSCRLSGGEGQQRRARGLLGRALADIDKHQRKRESKTAAAPAKKLSGTAAALKPTTKPTASANEFQPGAGEFVSVRDRTKQAIPAAYTRRGKPEPPGTAKAQPPGRGRGEAWQPGRPQLGVAAPGALPGRVQGEARQPGLGRAAADTARLQGRGQGDVWQPGRPDQALRGRTWGATQDPIAWGVAAWHGAAAERGACGGDATHGHEATRGGAAQQGCGTDWAGAGWEQWAAQQWGDYP